MSFSEKVALIAQTDPATRGAGTVSTTWRKVEASRPRTYIASVGAIASTGTFDFAIQQATDGSGTGAKAFKTATQLTDTDDSQAIQIECLISELDTANSFQWVRAQATVAAANIDYAILEMLFYDAAAKGYETNESFVAEFL